MADNGNIVLIDPNNFEGGNVNGSMTNAVPQYQDMFIFAELTAQRRGRTVLSKNGGATSNDQNDNVKINFIGSNQDKNNINPNNLKFTTNWYDGSVGNNIQYEGFGITSIKVVTNSSFIPQVSIQFVDIRGANFFNKSNSPYRILFDFPPPIFTLKIKGYYGKALSYKLHLVKYNSEFNSDTGNYVIDAQFVALTYAPLTDILFRYVVNFPLIEEGVNAKPDPTTPPLNTNELILKLKTLYTQSNNITKKSTETSKYESILKEINSVNECISLLYNFKSNEELTKIGNPTLVIYDNPKEKDQIRSIYSLSEYDSLINIVGNEDINNLDQSLFLAYLIGPNINNGEIDAKKTDPYTLNIINKLDIFRASELIGKSQNLLPKFIFDNDISLSNTTEIIVTDTTSDLYVYLDVSKYYTKLFNKRIDLQKSKNNSLNIINTDINNNIVGIIGIKPTIYNIFKIILDDVDKFFRILRKTSANAEKHHNDPLNIDKIKNGQYKDINKKKNGNIFSFPLVLSTSHINGNQPYEVRVAPKEISEQLKVPFPELELIDKFIKTFPIQQQIAEQVNAKSLQNTDGTYKWLPLSPADSSLVSTDLQSPYYSIDPQDINNQVPSEENKIIQIFRIFLERFYILSQNSFTYDFYDPNNRSADLVKMFSETESVNITSSITEGNITLNSILSTTINGFKLDVENFYKFITKNLSNLDFLSNKTSFSVSGVDLYVDKKNENYEGLRLNSDKIVPRTTGGDSPVDDYQNNTKTDLWDKFLNWGDNSKQLYGFTEQNIFFIKDDPIDGGNVKGKTRFLCDNSIIYITKKNSDEDYLMNILNGLRKPTNRKEYIDKEYGNEGFLTIGGNVNSGLVRDLISISDIWSDQLSKHDDEIYNTIINGFEPTNSNFNARISAIILLANFGYTLSPFNIYPYDLNKVLFTKPALIEIPLFLQLYIGALVGISIDDKNYIDLYRFFIYGDGKNLDSCGVLIFADIIDINSQLSKKDKEVFKEVFDVYFDNGRSNSPFYNTILSLKKLYGEINSEIKKQNLNDPQLIINTKFKLYQDALNSDKKTYYDYILEPLFLNDANIKNSIINYSEITFSFKKNYSKSYEGLGNINAFASEGLKEYKDKKTINNNFFKNFFIKLSEDIGRKDNELKKKEKERRTLNGDEDIVTQCYYSFKNINDKWLSEPQNDINLGYPFNNGRSLIESFAFVDRGMNPIGDTIINPEILIELFNDTNVSVFSVLAQLLSMNGFEFFPIQNFMSYTNDDWKKTCFKIDTIGDAENNSAFTCMYVGGSSSYPSDIYLNSEFEEDSIPNLDKITNTEFFTKESKDKNGETNPSFPYRQVRAFSVKFGAQNQSMFNSIKIDSKDYPETNESIQILSNLAKDNNINAPAPKGQNLYNLYENRAYKATVTGLGNVTIQPTQYFQIENVPMFNGAYIILSVEHSIEANKMTTSFSGVKILKYPVPRVTSPSAILGFQGGNTENSNSGMSNENTLTTGRGVEGNPTEAQYEAMYELRIE